MKIGKKWNRVSPKICPHQPEDPVNWEYHIRQSAFPFKNCQIWVAENPRAIQHHELHPIKCTVWSGVTAQEIIGPFWGCHRSVTVMGEHYRVMIQNFQRAWVQNQPELMWFVQDWATAYSARDTITLLKNIFENRIISCGCKFNWLPRSPNLTSPDILCGITSMKGLTKLNPTHLLNWKTILKLKLGL